MPQSIPDRDQMVFCRASLQRLYETLTNGISSIEDYKLTEPLDNLAVMAAEDIDPTDEARLDAKKRVVTLHIKEQRYWHRFHGNQNGPFRGKILIDLWMQVDSCMSTPWMKYISKRDILTHDDSKMFQRLHEMYHGTLTVLTVLLRRMDATLADDSYWFSGKYTGSVPGHDTEAVEAQLERDPDED